MYTYMCHDEEVRDINKEELSYETYTFLLKVKIQDEGLVHAGKALTHSLTHSLSHAHAHT